ncbi:hypothetical protein NPIL_192961 [Nephila pilipes]|uniref:Uncharacterized protein n=1 Tax=Nephila pilipes TaxID=299642 RepID=A0A8X6MTJ2_NEPPI|nr:hypothetical protein NPIL_192961 [Nephila pilipes]
MEERLARSASTLTDSRKDSNDSPEGALVSIVVEVSMSRAGPGADGVISGVVVVCSIPSGMAYSDFEKGESFKEILEATFRKIDHPYSDDKIEEMESCLCFP